MRALIMDIDGTLTDGTVYYTSTGQEVKAFNVKDGLGIKEILPRLGITPVFLTGRSSEILLRRAAELGVTEVYQNAADKQKTLQEIQKKFGWKAEEIAYLGDDINDLPAMQQVALRFCPADAVEAVKHVATHVLSKNGGQGAARECIEILSTLHFN